jgi:hypothetical protein
VVQRIGKSDTAHHLLSFSGMVTTPTERRNCGLPGSAAPGPRYDALGEGLLDGLGEALGSGG